MSSNVSSFKNSSLLEFLYLLEITKCIKKYFEIKQLQTVKGAEEEQEEDVAPLSTPVWVTETVSSGEPR